MIGVGISPYKHRFLASSIPTQAEATALFAQWTALGTPASAARQTIVNATIYYLKQAGIWNSLDVLYVFAAHSQAAGLVDWKNPSTRSATVSGTTTFLADTYIKGNGSTGKIDTAYNPADGGTYNFTQNVNNFGVYVQEHISESRALASVLSAGNVGNEIVTGTLFDPFCRNNNTTQRSVINLYNRGLFTSKRSASNAWSITRGGYDMNRGLAKPTDAAQALNNLNFYLLCRNANGAYSQFSNAKISYFYAGGSLDEYTLNDILEHYYLYPVSAVPRKRVTFNGNSFTANADYIKRFLTVTGYNAFDMQVRGISGQTTPQMQTDAVSTVFTKAKTWLTNDVFFVWELTNDMAINGSNATDRYNSMVSYLQALRTAVGTSAKIIVATMLPRDNAQITNSIRQNDADLFDDTTLNGKIRNHLVQDGYCDAICDVASDATMGIYSGGVAGVGEKNTTYYNVDELHPTTTGYNYLADNYITASIQAYL